VTGRPVFAGDLELPGMLHIAVLGSPHAHARITGIRTDEAESLDGVVLVLTHANTPTNRTFSSNMRVSYGDGSGCPWPAVV